MTTTGVSPTMKRAGILVALALAAVALYIWQRPRAVTTAASAPVAKTAAPPAPASAPGPAVAPTAEPVDKVRKLGGADERRQLADRIAAAQAARAATRAAPRPALPEPPSGAAMLPKATIRDAMGEMIPHLRECYEAALPTLPSPDVELTASIHLTGDPDVGTLVDADALTDKVTGAPLPTGFDDCLRSTFMLMALPPLAEGDTLEVRYPFKFSSN